MSQKINIGILFSAANRTGNVFSRVNGQVNKLESRVQNFNNKVNSLFSIGNMIGVGAGLGFLKLGADMEQTNVAFKVMLGSADKASKVLKKLNDFSNVTPFQNKEVIQAGRNLIAFGVEADNITAVMQRVGDVASGVKMPFTELAEIYGKIKVGNTAYNEDLNQLAGRGIPIFTELAKVMNVPATEIKKLSSEGKITFDEIDQAFKNMTSGTGQYAGMMAEMAKTAGGAWSTSLGKLLDGVTKLSVSIMPVVTDILNGFIPIVDKFNEFSQAHPELMKNILLVAGGLLGLNVAGKVFGVMRAGALVAASGILQPVSAIGRFTRATKLMSAALKAGRLGTYSALIRRYGVAGRFAAAGIWIKNKALAASKLGFAGLLGNLTGAIAKTWAWTAAMLANPITWVVAGIAALVVGVALAWKHFDKFRGVVVGAWEGIKKFGEIIFDTVIGAIQNLLSGIGKIGKAISLAIDWKFDEAWKVGMEGAKEIGSGLINTTPVGVIVETVKRRDEIYEAASAGYKKGVNIDTSNFLNFGGDKKQEPISASDISMFGIKADMTNPWSELNKTQSYLSPDLHGELNNNKNSSIPPGLFDDPYLNQNSTIPPDIFAEANKYVQKPSAAPTDLYADILRVNSIESGQANISANVNYSQKPLAPTDLYADVNYNQKPLAPTDLFANVNYSQKPLAPTELLANVKNNQKPLKATDLWANIKYNRKPLTPAELLVSIKYDQKPLSPTDLLASTANKTEIGDSISNKQEYYSYKNEVDNSQIEQLTRNITQNISNNRVANNNTNSNQSRIEINYQPQIHISAEMTRENQENLMDILNLQKDELMKIVKEELRKDRRLNYAG